MSGSDQNDSGCQSILACNASCEAVSRTLPAYARPNKADTKHVVVPFFLTHKSLFSMLVAGKSNVLSPNRTGYETSSIVDIPVIFSTVYLNDEPIERAKITMMQKRQSEASSYAKIKLKIAKSKYFEVIHFIKQKINMTKIGTKINKVIILMGLLVFVLSGNALALEKVTINLTPTERAWLVAHPEITIAHSFDWPPYSFLDSNNKPVGISIDFFELVAQLAGLKFKVHPDGLWNNIFEAGKNKQVDVVASMTITKKREEWFSFPRPYLFLSSYIITRKDYREIKHRDDLKGKKLSGAKGTWQVHDVLENYPSVTMDYVNTYSDALMAVSTGIVDATVITLGSALYDISQKGIYNLQLPAIYEKNTDLITFGVRNDWPELVSIIDKALAAIPEAKKAEIISKWMPPLESQLPGVFLSEEELAWLSRHKDIRLGVDSFWPPFEFLDTEGNMQGLSSSYVQMMNEKFGINMRPIKKLNQGEVLKKAQAGELDVLPSVAKSEKRSVYLNFSKPHSIFPMVILMRDDAPYIKGIGDLQGKKIAIIRGTITEEFLLRDFPEFNYLRFDIIDEALLAPIRGKSRRFYR